MYTEWTSHLQTDEEKERFKQSLRGSKTVMERLNYILNKRLVGLDRYEVGQEQFDNPSWPYKQAFNNGYRSCLMAMLKYTDIEGQLNEQSTGRQPGN